MVTREIRLKTGFETQKSAYILLGTKKKHQQMLKLSGRTSDLEQEAKEKICIGGAIKGQGCLKHLRTCRSFLLCQYKRLYCENCFFFLLIIIISFCWVNVKSATKGLTRSLCKATWGVSWQQGHLDVLTLCRVLSCAGASRGLQPGRRWFSSRLQLAPIPHYGAQRPLVAHLRHCRHAQQTMGTLITASICTFDFLV